MEEKVKEAREYVRKYYPKARAVRAGAVWVITTGARTLGLGADDLARGRTEGEAWGRAAVEVRYWREGKL